ncbi:hypothetical protein [Nocardia miyunensis]|nr:hypothetical protein [Nocardia miyunensis]
MTSALLEQALSHRSGPVRKDLPEDDELDSIAADADQRPAFQAAYPIHA